MNETIIIFPDYCDRARLDTFLAEKLKISRSKAGILISKTIFVNNQTKKPSYLLHAGDQITILSNQNDSSRNIISRIDDRSHKPKIASPLILYKDNDILIVNKPSGTSSHPKFHG